MFDAPVEEALRGWMEAVLGEPVKLVEVARLSGGACQDNRRLVVSRLDRPGSPEVFVLRSDADTRLPGSVDRGTEFEVIQAARAAGVRTPRARGLRRDLLRPGSFAYLLDWVEGTALGRAVVQSPELDGVRPSLARALAEELAKLHSIRRPAHPGLLERRVGWQEPSGSSDPVANTLAALRQRLDGLPEPHPALEWAYAWLVRHPPPPSELVLVHGDFRTGNFMVSAEGLAGVLDWEFAHWGYPEEDLAWISVRDWRFGVLDAPVGGFADRASFYRAYEEASGHPVNREAVHFWEVWGNVHWAVGCVLQGERYRSGQAEDLELIAVARRAAEMEFEALRLIEKGPH